MGDTTAIAWTDATWNPWQGCHKVSEACRNCYMYRDKKRYGQNANVVVRSSPATFHKPLTWKEPRKVFTCSWSDFFIEEADAWRDEAWEIISRTPHLTYQILTKRPERIIECLPSGWMDFNNVWLGTTAENQSAADKRIPLLLRNPAWMHFISVEPMLGPLNLKREWLDAGQLEIIIDTDLYQCLGESGRDAYTRRIRERLSREGKNRLDWVICGCESGPGARETKLEWVRDLRDQCKATGTPFFLKQLMIDGKLVSTPELDGVRHVEFPR